MNRLRTGLSRYLLVLACLLFFSAYSYSQVSADIAPPEQPPGAVIAPGQEITQVQMLSERVLIEVQVAPWPGVSLSSVVRDWARVTANFTMFNHGQAEETMQVRFPLTNPSGWGDGRGEYPEIEDFQAWVNGIRIPTVSVTAPSPITSNHPPVEWAGFDVTFPVGEEVGIEVRYSQRASGYHPQSEFTYILETGAGWKDAIGSGELILRLPYTASPENVLVQSSNAGVRFAGADARWSFDQLEPTWEDNLHITVIEPGYWLAVVDAQQAVDKNPADGEAWGVLGRALKRVVFEPKGWIREDEAGQALYDASVKAYEKAISLSPGVSKWHAGYAELLWHKIWFWPDYGAPEMIVLLEQLKTALDLEPQNEQAWSILEDLRYAAPLAVVVEDQQVDYLLLTATVQPSPTATPEVESTPLPSWTPAPSPTADFTETIPEDEPVETPLSEAPGSGLRCLGSGAVAIAFPLLITVTLRKHVNRDARHKHQEPT